MGCLKDRVGAFVPVLFFVPVSSGEPCYPLGQRALSDKLGKSDKQRANMIIIVGCIGISDKLRENVPRIVG